jgi:hypothetical protein
MIKDIWKRIIIPTALVIIFFVSLGILKSELWSTVILIACIAITFGLKHYRKEWLLMIIGIVVAAVFEIGGDAIYKMQQWSGGSFFGIPYWLPLLFGLEFVLVYRIGTVIVEKQSK